MNFGSAPCNSVSLDDMTAADFRLTMKRWYDCDRRINQEKRDLIRDWEKNISAILQVRDSNRKNEKMKGKLIKRLKDHKSVDFIAKAVNLATNKKKK